MGKFKKSFESIATGFFLLMFFIGPISMFGMNLIKKNYHLNNYADYLYPEKFVYNSNRIYYSFSSGGRLIHKSQTLDKEAELNIITKKIPVVKYSIYNPKIAVLIFIEKNPE